MSFISLLTFVKKTPETDDVYTFSFKPNKALNHKAGQHGLFIIPGLYRPHPFTVSSAPDEEFVTFSTHTGTGSAFKNKLMKLKPGAKMIFVGPLLNFTFLPNVPSHVFLAQGIGVTPFRSMLVHAKTVDLPADTTLIHVDSKAHAFKDMTQQLATQAYYPANVEEFTNFLKKQDATKVFYLSGSPRFVASTKRVLSEMGVPKKKVRTDSFWGY